MLLALFFIFLLAYGSGKTELAVVKCTIIAVSVMILQCVHILIVYQLAHLAVLVVTNYKETGFHVPDPIKITW